jgi:hypothetical protein
MLYLRERRTCRSGTTQPFFSLSDWHQNGYTKPGDCLMLFTINNRWHTQKKPQKTRNKYDVGSYLTKTYKIPAVGIAFSFARHSLCNHTYLAYRVCVQRERVCVLQLQLSGAQMLCQRR